MLLELRVKNYAIMEDLALEFGQGLNILTGETGTGKSIIIDALSLLLGDRADPELIRTGSQKATVEGVFDLSGNPKLLKAAEEGGIELEDGVLCVKRVVSREGRGRCHMNQSSVSLSTLKKMGDETLDIHGQHQHQSLLNTEKHLELLDGFGNLGRDREVFGRLFREYTSTRLQLEELERKSQTLREKHDFVSFQVNEIETAKLRSDEDTELERERDILDNYEKLVTNLGQAHSLLYEADESVVADLSSVMRFLGEATKIDSSIGGLLERLETCHCEVEDISRSIEGYLSKREFDPERLEEVNTRLDRINRLKKKYGSTITEVLLTQKRLQEELVGLETLDERRDTLEAELKGLTERIRIAALTLSEARRRVAEELEQKVVEELQDLGMEKVQFKIAVEPNDDPEGLLEIDGHRYSPGPTGIDSVEFLISPNLGEELKPLRKIASGGELSRIMLSIKSILARIDEIPIMVFDEIDVGIGGRTAEAVGRKLRNVSEKRQILCITHLPQIAAYGDVHYVVNKHESGGRTHTEVRRLESEERVEEMARMLGGEEITDLTRETAAQLLGRVARR